MLHGDYVKHDLTLVISLLMLGIRNIEPNDHNHEERTIMRCALSLLEFMSRNVDAQMEKPLIK